MINNRVKISSIIQNLVPEYVKESYPLAVEFLRQYYVALDSEGGVLDLLQNIDKYVDVDNLVNYSSDTTITQEVLFSDDVVNVVSTRGFPDNWGLIRINDEIITYEKKTDTQFINCYRGFSGITSYKSQDNPEELTFSSSDIAEHVIGDKVENLNGNLLNEFFKKLKVLITPGFENKDLFSELNTSLFVKQSGDFYRAKGTDSSFKILFGALFGKPVEVIRPRDFLIEPSAAQYLITKDLVVEVIEGNPEKLVNSTLYQDEDEFLYNSSGTINKVEKIIRGDNTYYVLSLDYDANKNVPGSGNGNVFGDFNIHPKTKIVNDLNQFSSIIDVDSTVGFPESGELLVNLTNGISFVIKYESKSINQFYNCSGILTEIPAQNEVKLNVFAYGYDGDSLVKVRITGVISDIDIPKTKYYNKNQTIKIENLGYSTINDVRLDNWIQNFSLTYDVKSIELIDSFNFIYKVEVYDLHSFNSGDSITIISNAGDVGGQILIEQGSVVAFNNKNSFIIGGQGELDVNLNYRIRKNLTKPKFSNFSLLNYYNSNVQFTYFDPTDSSVYVTSSCLPSYNQTELETIDGSIILNENFAGEVLTIGTHYFYTGDSVTYTAYSESSELSTGVYFVERVSPTQIKLARSKNNIENNTFIEFNGLLNGVLRFTYFNGNLLENRTLFPQNIVRKIPETPTKTTERIETKPGYIGIFNNGIELLNYKSRDSVFFGGIETVSVTSEGDDYDVMRPPVVQISDDVGVGATVYSSVRGNLKEIQVINSGFDYLETPKIIIVGGNGKNAEAEANLVIVDHIVQFNSTSSGINTSTNIITTNENHKFRDYEEVIYDSQSQSTIGDLVSGASYFIEILSANTLKLYPTLLDASNQTNNISLTGFGIGNHILRAKFKKNTIKSISIKNPGVDYKNRKCVISSVGINTAANLLNINNHLFENKDIIKYNTTGTPIGGLVDNGEYYVKVVDDNNIRLCEISIIGNKDTNYSSNLFVNFTDRGVGDHYFNHKPIEVLVSGTVGVSSYSSSECVAIIQPIFSGQIYSLFVHNSGASYGSESIINYSKQPEFLIDNGSMAQIKPIISNGKIVDVVVINSGTNYISPPELIIDGDGGGAILTPIINSGILESVKVISTGSGYAQGKTNIEVVSRGSGAKFFANIKQWRINAVSRAISSGIIKNDDGFISDTISGEATLEYSHAYAPRKLREITLAEKFFEGETFYTSDLQNDYNPTPYHSPIIGWAYDGNPIYGPYAYDSPSGGEIRALRSGYELNISDERPSVSIYPVGFFVQDYVFTNSGDLDESNGRFGITPDFPNGTYAYFAIVDHNGIENTGVFNGYRKPIFPYVIGNTFKYTPVDFNFYATSKQNLIDFNKTGWLRNTKLYNLFSDTSEYQFLENPNKIKNQISTITNTSKGKLSGFNIVSGGKNYSIKDKIVINSNNENTRKARASISKIDGATVSKISVASTFVNNVEVLPFNNSFIGISTIPHGFNNGDLVTVTTDYEYNQTQNIKVPSNNLTLINTVQPYSTTGIVTFFTVVGNLDRPWVRENDTYTINDEQIKVLSIDKLNSRIKVERNYNNFPGINTHFAGSILTQNQNKLFLGSIILNNYQYKENREYYINPVESVGIGTSYGIGIDYTLEFNNPGAGINSVVIPTRTIYIPSHQISTGDVLVYNSNGGTQVSISTDGVASSLVDNNAELYAVKISNDLISLAQERVGINSVGEIVGINDSSVGLLYFTGIGTGVEHSLRTTYDTNINATISQNIVTVFTEEPHNLSVNDAVNVDCKSGITTTVKIEYNDYNRRLIVNSRYFESENVNTVNNTIKIINHNLSQGQKIIHTSLTPCGGLDNEGMYYVQRIDENNFKLTRIPYTINDPNVEIVDITSPSFGNILPINPPIEVFKNSTILFDVSDPSLSFSQNSIDYPAFNFFLYTDSQLTNEFNTSQDSEVFEMQKIGTIGVDSDAKIILTINDKIPSILYYALVPINLSSNLSVKTEIIVDDLVANHNKISIKNSLYNGPQIVKQVSPNNFSYYIPKSPEQIEYTSQNSILKYTTTSTSALGGISSIRLISSGNSYENLPLVSVVSDTGSGAIIFSDSEDIGSALKVNIEDIGFNYSCDLTLRPSAKFPTILKVDPLSAFDYIGISSVGQNYFVAPNLVVIDSFTEQVVEDVSLVYELGDSQVTILNNSNGFYNNTPKIIPVNNTNGIPISNVDFNIVNNDVIVTLGASFSDPEDFPFQVGDKVLIENVGVTESTGVVGFNSKNYNYALFELTNIDSNISGIAVTVSYNLTNILNSGELPGTYDNINSYGRIIAEKEFPIFDIKLKKNEFFNGENVTTVSGEVGTVESWDKNNEILVLSSIDNFTLGSLLIGESSNSQGIISRFNTYSSYYNIKPSSVVVKGWATETGFLNNSLQRLIDSNYYQYFSYSLKSEVDISKWDETVSNLNHTAGFKKFGDLQVISTAGDFSGISTEQNGGDFYVINNLLSVIDQHCYYDFDLVRENSIILDNQLTSNEVYFNSRILQNYVQSVGNMVLTIDDLSPDFDTDNKKDFDLTCNGNPIFQRTFNPQSDDFNLVDNTIRLPEHFFVTGEKINYDPGVGGLPIGISTINVVGIGATELLPSTLYVVKQSDIDVKVAVSASDALATNPITVDFTTSGVGTVHTLTSTQQNSKVLLSIDNVIQSPLTSLGSTTILHGSVSLLDDTITVVDPTDLVGADVIKIDDEIMRISAVGVGSTGTILVQRPWFGTEIANHNADSLVTKMGGNYNIRNNTLSFIDAPHGLLPTEDSNSPLDLDYTGIQTSSTFSGRVFIRSGIENGLTDVYSTNYTLDNISTQFTGITSEFTLQQDQGDIVGIASDHAIILVNQILQQPKRDSSIPIEGNYDIIDNGGSSAIQFNGYTPTGDYDINSGTLPRGGIILSVGSTQGYGYQPLVSAAGTAIVSIAGTISNISIGNTGSGYRAKELYEILTSTAATVGIGSTVIILNNENSIFGILSVANTGNNCTISIGTYFAEVPITGVATNSITISGISTILHEIPINTPVLIDIHYSPVGVINVGVAVSSVGIATITNIGFAQINQGNIDSVIITNTGTGFTSTNLPIVVFESPLPYESLPLIYSASSPTGIGTGARASVVVGQGSSIIEFEISNYGYGYNKNEVLALETDGLYGVPLDNNKAFTEFNIFVNKTYNDVFSGWVVGELQLIDPIDSLFDGVKTQFPIKINDQRVTIRAKSGSDIDIQSTLIITVNDVLQVPGQGFVFNGGSNITFTTAPKTGDTAKILFYGGTRGVDTQVNEILALAKVGDKLKINSDEILLQQSQRQINEVMSTDTVKTNLYSGNGITEDISLLRPVTLCHQRNDLFLNGQEVTKDREIYNYNFAPSLTLLKSIDPTSTVVFIDDARPYLKSTNNVISLTIEDSWVVGAAATAVVSIAGTISSIIITEGGAGYTNTPAVSISYPIGFGSTVAALGVASVTSGIVTMVSVTSPGSFYTTTNPPQVLIETPQVNTIDINNANYEGDFGQITGIAATSIIGIAPIGLELDFYIPENSYLRDESVVGTAITISGIQTGYYFAIRDSNVGNSPISYDSGNNVIGFGSTYLDSAYEVAQVSIASSDIPGVGNTFVQRVVVKVSDNTFSGISTNFYGNFSWGRLSGFNGRISTEFYSFYS